MQQQDLSAFRDSGFRNSADSPTASADFTVDSAGNVAPQVRQNSSPTNGHTPSPDLPDRFR